jgi:hypothetical protein
MPHDPNALFDSTVLDMIERSPVGAVPNTPTYQDAVIRLHGAHQVYAHADHKGGHVTARSLAAAPRFFAANLDALAAGGIDSIQLESNDAIFTRYVASLSPDIRPQAEQLRATIAMRPPVHRDKIHVVHDPVNTLVLIPGTGPHHGLPGNYLHGAIVEHGAEAKPAAWSLALHDCDDGVAIFDAPTLAAAVAALHEAVECAPFHLEEVEALGFRIV